MRGAIYTVIGSTVFLGILFFPSKTGAVFMDVPQSHPHYDAIEYMQRARIVQGYPDGMFRPDQTINRAEFVKIIVGGFSADKLNTTCDADWPDFPDVPRGSWFALFVYAARCEGLVAGYPDGTFRPSDNISFVEGAKIITIQHAKQVGMDSPSDGGPSGLWYASPVARLEAYNAIPFSVVSLTDLLTRGEMAELLYRLYERRYNQPSRTLEDFGISADWREGHFFNRQSLQQGDALSYWNIDMNIESISQKAIIFSGEGILHGNYKEQSASHSDCPLVVFNISNTFLPRERGNEAIDEICLENSIEELHRHFHAGTSGTVNMDVSRYSYSLMAGQKHRALMEAAYVEPDASTINFSSTPEHNWLEWPIAEGWSNGYFEFYIYPSGGSKGAGIIYWSNDNLNPSILQLKQGQTKISPDIDLSSLSPEIQENATKIQRRQVLLSDLIFINDFNDDGYADIRIVRSRSPTQHSFWHYDPAQKEFVEQ